MSKNSKTLEIDLTGRTAIVTGASGTIGAEIALQLCGAGAKVALHYRRSPPEELIKSINEMGGTCVAVCADLNVTGFEVNLLENIETQLGKPDILVNCAADQGLANLSEIRIGDFEKMMRTNVASVFALSRQFANRLEAHTPSAIINISSIEGTRPARGHGVYATSKAALEMLTKAMALEFGHKGLRVNAIAPGLIARQGIENDWPEGVKRWRDVCPLGRMGHKQDVANGVVFLASDLAGFINGTTLTIDGGMGATQGW